MDHSDRTVQMHEGGHLPAAPHLTPTGAHPGSPAPSHPHSWLRSRKGRAILWGAGSTTLSGVGLIGLALFEQYNGMISELRSDLKHFNDSAGEYVKKDRFNKCTEHMKDSYRELCASRAAREQLERELRASERAREELVKVLQRFRERLAYVEGMKAVNPAADVRAAIMSPADDE